jgi:hypothetical protein
MQFRIPSTKFFYQFIFKNLVEDVSWVFQPKLFFVLGKKSVQSFAPSFPSLFIFDRPFRWCEERNNK